MERKILAIRIMGPVLLVATLLVARASTTLADAVGACCQAHGSCLDDYTPDTCSNVGGAYQGDAILCSGTTCEPVPCGESGSPVCGGTCPLGTRCIDTEKLQAHILFLTVSVTGEEQGETSSSSCACTEVLCGGVRIDNGQGCCAGKPFTIGVEGCCNGSVVPVESECVCSVIDLNNGPNQVEPEPIDLRDTGCCELSLSTDVAGGEAGFDSNPFEEFNVAEAGCCQRRFTRENPFAEPPSDEVQFLLSSVSTYTFGTGLDCCPGEPTDPPVLDDLGDLAKDLELAGLCVGACVEAQCAAQGCCQCNDCETEFPSSCLGAGSQSACESLCRTLACESHAYVADGSCSEDGLCVPPPAQAPAASRAGLVALLMMLAAVGGFAILRRRAS